MRLDSNVRGVIGRMQRLKDRDIPMALQRTVNPARWREPALAEATRVLEALATAEQRRFVADFLRTVKALVFPGIPGFVLRMATPFGSSQTLADYQAARRVVQPYDLGENLFQKDVRTFEDLMVEWVQTEKRKDARDEGKTDEEIGQLISYLMLNPNPTANELAARNKLLPHITSFLQRKQTAGRLEAAVVDAWLRAVLAAWRQMVKDLWPEIFRKELRAARQELALKPA